MTWWTTVKTIHVTSVVGSLSLFVLRGKWMLAESPRLRQRWVKIVPHVVDTVLLASAVTLALMSYQYPFVENWLTAKVIALFVYIALGMVALRFGETKRVRATAWAAGILVFVYIASVAVTRNPMPFLS